MRNLFYLTLTHPTFPSLFLVNPNCPNFSKVLIDPELVAKEYLKRCKSGTWKKENTDKALKCWNLECIIETESFGQSLPEQLTMGDFVGEGNDSSQDGVIEIED